MHERLKEPGNKQLMNSILSTLWGPTTLLLCKSKDVTNSAKISLFIFIYF